MSKQLDTLRRKLRAVRYPLRDLLLVTSLTAILVATGLGLFSRERLADGPASWIDIEAGNEIAKLCLASTFLALAALFWYLRSKHNQSGVPHRLLILCASAQAVASVATLDAMTGAALPGTFCIFVGFLMNDGDALRRRMLEPRLKVRVLLRPAIFSPLTTSRNRVEIGSGLICLGMALWGMTLLHWLLALPFILLFTMRIAQYEHSLRSSGEADHYVRPWWPLKVTTGFVLTLVYLALIGLAIDRDIQILETSPNSQTPLVLQAILGTQGAALTFVFAVLALIVQLRASSFGTDIATRLQDWRGLQAVAFVVIAGIAFTTVTLGNWSGWGHTWAFADLALLTAAGSLSCLCFGAMRLFTQFGTSKSLIDPIAELALDPKLESRLSTFGLNWDSGRWMPDAVHFLNLSLIGAQKQGDLELFADILTRWSWNLKRQPFLSRMVDLPIEARLSRMNEIREKKSRIPTWEAAHAFEGLDRALSRSARTISSAVKYDRDYIYKLTSLCDLVYAPLSEHHSKQIQTGLPSEKLNPGMKTLYEFVDILGEMKETEGIKILISEYWRERATLAISWAERITAEDEKNGSYPRIQVAEDLVDWAEKLGKHAIENGWEEVRSEVIQGLMLVASQLESRAGLISALKALSNLAAFQYREFYLWLDEFNSIVSKDKMPANWVLEMASRISEHLPLSNVSATYFMRFLAMIEALVKRINGDSDVFVNISEDQVATIAWIGIRRELEYVESNPSHNPLAALHSARLVMEFAARLPEGFQDLLRSEFVSWASQDQEGRGGLTFMFDAVPRVEKVAEETPPSALEAATPDARDDESKLEPIS